MTSYRLLGLLAFAAGSMATIACGGGGGGGGGSGGGTATGGSGGGQSCGGTVAQPAYSTCGPKLQTLNTCPDGACAADALAQKVYAAWKAQVKTYSGMDDAAFAARVKIGSVDSATTPDGVTVSVGAVVVLDWIELAFQDDLGFIQPAATDAEIQTRVTELLDGTQARWAGVGAVTTAPTTATIQASFNACTCALTVDYCDARFENVTGKARVRAKRVVDAAANKCKEAWVDLETGQLDACTDQPCAVN
jgi:hypothetical protein